MTAKHSAQESITIVQELRLPDFLMTWLTIYKRRTVLITSVPDKQYVNFTLVLFFFFFIIRLSEIASEFFGL